MPPGTSASMPRRCAVISSSCGPWRASWGSASSAAKACWPRCWPCRAWCRSRAMSHEFSLYRDQIAADLAKIRQRAPSLVTVYRERLRERVQSLLSELDIKIDRSDLIKEVSIFAERSDVAEEVVRLASHLDQFQEVLNEPESPGRKLEFLTQEMFREANTIGSKAGDVEISRRVVEIKGTLEKIRELVQNVE